MSLSMIRRQNRTYPLNQPQGWKPKYPRYMLELPEDVKEICIMYIGIQPRHDDNPAPGLYTELQRHWTTTAQRTASMKIESWIRSSPSEVRPNLCEKLYVETGYDIPNTEMYILYWAFKEAGSKAILSLDLQEHYRSLLPQYRRQVGLWQESFTVPKSRFETIYSGNDYQPGLSSLPGAEQIRHSFTGYWGAARDRLPASADDPFDCATLIQPPKFDKDTKGRSISGQSNIPLVHIRSGQYWGNCSEDERAAYEDVLEPVMRRGMAFLEANPAQTGDFGLRFSRNLVTGRQLRGKQGRTRGRLFCRVRRYLTSVVGSALPYSRAEETDKVPVKQKGGASAFTEAIPQADKDFEPLGLMPDCRPDRQETCSSGFFRSLKDLELWAAKNSTHTHIFHGAHEHSAKFGKTSFKMRTWHEVAALKTGEIAFAYINCHTRTGLMPFLDLDSCASFLELE